jgi:hypothetical protein
VEPDDVHRWLSEVGSVGMSACGSGLALFVGVGGMPLALYAVLALSVVFLGTVWAASVHFPG